MPGRIARLLILLLLVLLSPLFSPSSSSAAQGYGSAYDLISTVNGLRTSLGLAPYQIVPWLMSYAQEHADYIVSIGHGTHRHSDGTLPWENGIQENVAGGDFITVYDVVYNIWVDEGHRKTMVGYPGGWIGAGMAVDGNGTVNYVIDVRPARSFATGTTAPIATVPFCPSDDQHSQAGWRDHPHRPVGRDAVENCCFLRRDRG